MVQYIERIKNLSTVQYIEQVKKVKVVMSKSKTDKKSDKWLEALGAHINDLILQRGYKSPYEFWIQEIGDEISRATLHYILNGEVDMKVTTLKKIAQALKLTPAELIDFESK